MHCVSQERDRPILMDGPKQKAYIEKINKPNYTTNYIMTRERRGATT
jgi:hypothetical protein